MKTELARLVEDLPALGDDRQLRACRPVGGGCSQQAWQLEFSDGRRLFAKGGMPAMLEAERRSLEALHAWVDASCLQVPLPVALVGIAHDRAWLLLPWLDQGQGDQTLLGRGLARLHRGSAAAGPGRFGWPTDGFIGLGPQPGGWRDRWGEAFVDLRLRPQIVAARHWGLEAERLEPLLQVVADRLNQHAPQPALVHGDLWAGNAAVLADGRGLLIDPASWWADREVDLAMTRLFGGFSEAFHAAYRDEWPLSPGGADRVELYNLYHLLNHANLFGGGYRQQCRQTLRHVLDRWG